MLAIAHFYLFVFGALTIAGGILGFVNAKSKASLIAGGISGVALMAAGYLAGAAATWRIGMILGLVVSAALAGRFVGAYRKSKKLMPAGVMAALGIVGVVLTAVALATAA